MYKRLVILVILIVSTVAGLCALGYHAIEKWSQGLEGSRIGEFASVAEQVRKDVRTKLTDFITQEQNRPYSDFQYSYVPSNTVGAQQQTAMLRSPLAETFENQFASGYFQVEPDGRIITPYAQLNQQAQNELETQALGYVAQLKKSLIPALSQEAGRISIPHQKVVTQNAPAKVSQFEQQAAPAAPLAKEELKNSKSQNFDIDVLRSNTQQPKVIAQKRSIAWSNSSQTTDTVPSSSIARQTAQQLGSDMAKKKKLGAVGYEKSQPLNKADERAMKDSFVPQRAQEPARSAEGESVDSEDLVQIRVEPFMPVLVAAKGDKQSIFGGDLYLLRHVQVEQKHLLQGFKLNETRLLNEIKDSAEKFMRSGMAFRLDSQENTDSTYAAILDFGFGQVVLNLFEQNPNYIAAQVNQLKTIYWGILGVAAVAVSLALANIWRAMHQQIQLAQKKDDFISAVSHELRAPLTSIRMYSEMLEKNWVKSQEKAVQYYKNMRLESERLSRLIENVLDFSRMQKSKKQYNFKLGDINRCVAGVVDMMSHYAAEHGFVVTVEFGNVCQVKFDSDAITQIIVNLLDNAIKYARDAEDKTIIVRSFSEGAFVIIEVEDHGPGVPFTQRKKIFEEFYRTQAESTRETAGTGLGLALVRKFAQAHKGYVEVRNADRTGAIFRVALASAI